MISFFIVGMVSFTARFGAGLSARCISDEDFLKFISGKVEFRWRSFKPRGRGRPLAAQLLTACDFSAALGVPAALEALRSIVRAPACD